MNKNEISSSINSNHSVSSNILNYQDDGYVTKISSNNELNAINDLVTNHIIQQSTGGFNHFIEFIICRYKSYQSKNHILKFILSQILYFILGIIQIIIQILFQHRKFDIFYILYTIALFINLITISYLFLSFLQNKNITINGIFLNHINWSFYICTFVSDILIGNAPNIYISSIYTLLSIFYCINLIYNQRNKINLIIVYLETFIYTFTFIAGIIIQRTTFYNNSKNENIHIVAAMQRQSHVWKTIFTSSCISAVFLHLSYCYLYLLATQLKEPFLYFINIGFGLFLVIPEFTHVAAFTYSLLDYINVDKLISTNLDTSYPYLKKDSALLLYIVTYIQIPIFLSNYYKIYSSFKLFWNYFQNPQIKFPIPVSIR